jgi:hypothetical protein
LEDTKNTFENEFTEKFALFESQISNLRKDFDIKNKHIMSLETKKEEMVKEEQVYKKIQEKKMKELENSCKLKKSKEKTSETIVPEDLTVNCFHFDFKSTYTCDVCGKVFENEIKLKKHIKSQNT